MVGARLPGGSFRLHSGPRARLPRPYVHINRDRWDEDRDNLDALIAKMRNAT